MFGHGTQVQYGHHVEKSGIYITLLDIMHIVLSRGKNLVCLIYDDDGPKLLSIVEILENMNITGVEDVSKNPDFYALETWFVIVTRADFQKGSFLTLNHFQPGWHKKQMGEEAWEDCKIAATKRLMQEEAKHAKEMAEFENYSQTMDKDEAEGLRQSLKDRAANMEAEFAFFKACAALDVYTEPVPADGNCGLWTCLALAKGKPKPGRGLTHKKPDVLNLRSEAL